MDKTKNGECKMRILVYGLSKSIGGVSEYLLNVSDALYKKQIYFDYIAPFEDTVYLDRIKNYAGFLYSFVSKSKGIIFSNIDYYKKLKKLRKNHEIFYYNISANYYPLPVIIAKILKYRIVIHSHGSKDKKAKKILILLNNLFQKLIYKIADVRLSCSPEASMWLYGTAEKVNIIPNGIDIKKYNFNNKIRKKIRDSMSLNEKIVIGHVGNFFEVKNHKFIINLAKKIIKENENYFFILVGDGPLKKEIEEMIEVNNLKKYFCLTGSIFNVADFYSAFDFFVFPSFNEGFPFTVIEAQASGLKCLLHNNITKTIKLIPNLKFLALDIELWKKDIMNSNKKYKRIVKYDNFVKYDIKNSSKVLIKILKNIK